MNKKQIILNDGTLLKVGKLYKYSGVTENLYNSFKWTDLCRIVKITNDSVHIREPFENKLYKFSFDKINGFDFKPWWKW